ncbi:hypothetical protein LTS09_017544 [Friedmanniomyces endolithicus]|nr:hypothetical protein LTS09_017544 [Friedmanniomyces endolithicus]
MTRAVAISATLRHLQAALCDMSLPVAVLSRFRDAAAFIRRSLRDPGQHRSPKLTSPNSEYDRHPHPSLSENNTHPLTSLPDELLVSITLDLNNADHLSLKQTSRRFYYLLGTSAQDLDDAECDQFLGATRQDMVEKATAREYAGDNIDYLRTCSVCCDVHPRAAFSKAQSARASRSVTLLDIRDLYFTTQQRELKASSVVRDNLDQSDLVGGNGDTGFGVRADSEIWRKYVTNSYHNCSHRNNDFPNWALASHHFLRIRTAQDGSPGADVHDRYTLGTNILRAIEAGSLASTAYVNVIRRRMIAMAVQLCPHASTAEHCVYTRFEIDCALPPSYGVFYMGIPELKSGCGHLDCSMNFYFQHYRVDTPSIVRSQIGFRDEIWLRVDRCELPLPISAQSWMWRASTAADDMLKPAEATLDRGLARRLKVGLSSCVGRSSNSQDRLPDQLAAWRQAMA